LFIGKAYEFVDVRRLSGERSREKRVRIPPTRYWCDRPVYIKGVLKGVVRRQE